MKGFTLIETLIAITILTLAIAGPMVTASRSIVAAQTARDQLTASYLAQEGMNTCAQCVTMNISPRIRPAARMSQPPHGTIFSPHPLISAAERPAHSTHQEAWVPGAVSRSCLALPTRAAAVSDATFKRYLRVHRAGRDRNTIHAYDTSD